MWRGTRPALVLLAVWWQVPPCPASCPLYGLTAACSFKNLHWVPTLPSNITMLFLEFNHISEINRTSLRALEHLQRIDLGRQSVPLLLRNNAFLRQKRLLVLVLGFNPGLRLEPRAFAGLFNLRQLYLDHCSLNQSVLSGSYLEPLLSLETLDLFGNMISRLQPGAFFLRLRRFRELNLKLNEIQQICQGDLAGFTGKNFTLLSLHSTRLAAMSAQGFDWETCGNPFQGIAFDQLDLSSTLLSVQSSEKFFKAIEGTPIRHLIFSGHIGKGFSYEWQTDPDQRTFEGLRNSEVDLFDLSKNHIFALQPKLFWPLRNVTIVDMSINKINQILPGAFRGIQGHVRALNLSFNLLGEVHSYMFFNLTKLQILDLSQNHIGALGIGAFDGLPRLQALFLTGNSLRRLHTAAPLPNLEYLHLADNKLLSLYHMEVLAGNSTYVDISENKLTDLGEVYEVLARFRRLQTFFYGGNFVKWCNPDKRFPVPSRNSLQVLDLHDSSLQILWAQGRCLDLFVHMDNVIGLNISFNSLAALPQGIFSGLSSIVEIDLSFNALTYLEPDVFPSSLRNLYLSNNFLASVDPAPLGDLFILNLAHNRFHCDCALWGFLAWLNVTQVGVLGTSADYLCEFPAAQHNRPLLDFSLEVEPCHRDDEPSVRGLRLALLLFWGAAVVSLTLGGLLYARLRGRIFRLYKRAVGRVLEGPQPPVPPEDQARYDAYLCFSQRDSAWVEEALLGKLDQQFSERNPLRCCFEARDFLPGEDHLSNIRDAVWSSSKTVCVVSNEFLKDGWCLEAFLLAQGRMLEELTDLLIMLVVGKMQHYQLMRHEALRAFVQRKEYLCWPEDPQDLDWFYQCLFSKILKQKKVRMAGRDRGEQEQEQEQERAEQGQEAIPMQEFRAQRHPGPREEPLEYAREEQLHEVRLEQLEYGRDRQPQGEQLQGVREEQLEYAREQQLHEVRREQLEDGREEQLEYAREEQLEYGREERREYAREEKLEYGREEQPQKEQLEGVRGEQLHDVGEEQLEYGREEQCEYAREEQLEYGREKQPQKEQLEGVRGEKLHDIREEQLEYGRGEQLEYGGEEQPEYAREEQLEYGREEQPQKEQLEGVRGEQLHDIRGEQLEYGREEQLEYGGEEQPEYAREEQLEYGREEQPQKEQLEGVRGEQLHDIREEQLEYGREEQPEYAREEQLEYGREERPQDEQLQGVIEERLHGVQDVREEQV